MAPPEEGRCFTDLLRVYNIPTVLSTEKLQLTLFFAESKRTFCLSKKNHLRQSSNAKDGVCMVLRTGVEPVSAVPETAVLSIERPKHAFCATQRRLRSSLYHAGQD